jgi:hypothetical protein
VFEVEEKCTRMLDVLPKSIRVSRSKQHQAVLKNNSLNLLH